MSNFSIRPTTPEDAELTRQLMEQYWGGEPLLIQAKKFYPSQLNGLIAMRDKKPIAFLFYKIEGISCEIIVFEVLDKFKGIGTEILNELIETIKNKDCQRIFLMTSNDNLDALRFYQRRGFHICGIHIDSMKESRKLKPRIPMEGEFGIPLRDEIDLEMIL